MHILWDFIFTYIGWIICGIPLMVLFNLVLILDPQFKGIVIGQILVSLLCLATGPLGLAVGLLVLLIAIVAEIFDEDSFVWTQPICKCKRRE